MQQANRKVSVQSKKIIESQPIESDDSDSESERIISIKQLKSLYTRIKITQDTLEKVSLEKEVDTHEMRKKLLIMEEAYDKHQKKIRDLETQNNILNKDLVTYKEKKKITDVDFGFDQIDEGTRRKNYDDKLKNMILQREKDIEEYRKKYLVQ
jgi:hypothetical protein